MPSRFEAYATARPWFPVDAATTPFLAFSLDNEINLLKAPLHIGSGALLLLLGSL